MSGCPNYGHATRTPSNNLIGTAYIGEQYRVEPGDGKDEPWTSAANPDGSQFSSQGYLSRVHSSTQDHYPTIGRNQRPSSMTLDQDRDIQRQYGGPSHSFLQPGFIDPAQLSNSGASYDQSPSLRTFDDRYNWAETHNDPQVNPLAYVSCQRPGQLRATAVFRNGHEAACRGQYDQPSMVFADNYGVVERHVPTLATVNHLLIAPIQRPDNVFVPGVLKRQQGHEQQLDVYTDQLLGRLSTSTDDHLVHANLDVAPAPNPTSFYGPIGDRQQTVIQPPSFDTIRMQGSRAIGNINQITEQRIPSWYVTEDAPVVVEPDTSDSRPRNTSDNRLHPGTSPLVSNAPSLTNTDASSLVWYCSFNNCNTRFTGRYGKGNLSRHRRQKHNGQIVQYHCRDVHCARLFKRKDARLKHHRKAHPYLDDHVTSHDDRDDLRDGDCFHDGGIPGFHDYVG